MATVPRHYIVRTSWVIGDGQQLRAHDGVLAERGVDPRVVDDQVGRLTFAPDVARGIRHLLASRPAYGVYNLSGAGEATSWADVARQAFALLGHDPGRISGVSTAEYFTSSKRPVAPRPLNSMLDLAKIRATGFTPRDAAESLEAYLAGGGGKPAAST